MKKLNVLVEDFITALEAAVLQKGEDYIYTIEDSSDECLYLKYEDQEILGPSCLIGHALVSIGVDVEVIRDFEYSNAKAVLSAVTDLPASVVEAAQTAQEVQDRGGFWGEALQEFKLTLDGVR